MEKQMILDRLDALKKLVENSESNMRTAVISYRQYQKDLQAVMDELNLLEDEISQLKGRSIFNLWFGDPLKAIDNHFDQQVHNAIEEVEKGDE